MKMKKTNSGRLRAIGYDARARIFQVQLDNNSTLHLPPLQQLGGGMKLLSR